MMAMTCSDLILIHMHNPGTAPCDETTETQENEFRQRGTACKRLASFSPVRIAIAKKRESKAVELPAMHLSLEQGYSTASKLYCSGFSKTRHAEGQFFADQRQSDVSEMKREDKKFLKQKIFEKGEVQWWTTGGYQGEWIWRENDDRGFGKWKREIGRVGDSCGQWEKVEGKRWRCGDCCWIFARRRMDLFSSLDKNLRIWASLKGLRLGFSLAVSCEIQNSSSDKLA